jgi:hypothetical protein
MPTVLFWSSLVSGGIVASVTLFADGQTKAGLVAFPFLLLLAAAVAKYLGL